MTFESLSRSLVLLTLTLLVGCSSLQPPAETNLISPLAVIAANIELEHRQSTLPGQHVERAAVDAGTGLVWPDPGHAQRWAIRHSPVVQEMVARLHQSQAEAWNESMLENPGFELGLLEPEGGSGRWQLEAGVELGLADWLTRSARVDRADATHLVNQLDVLDELTDYLHQVRDAWLNAVAARQQRQVHEGLYQTAATLLEFAQQVQAAGNMNELDFLVYETEHARQHRALHMANLSEDIAISELQALLGLLPDQQPELPDSLPEVPNLDSMASLSTDQAMNLAAQHQPRLRLLNGSLNQQFARERLIRRQYGLLDGAIQLGAERESSGERRLALGASFELPLFDRGQAHLAEVEAARSALLAQIEQTRNTTRHSITQALMSQQAAIELAQQVSREDLPRHQRMLELALQEYNFMLRDTFSLLILREQIFDAQLEYIEHTLAYWHAQSLLLSVMGTEAVVVTQTGDTL
ncbi:MAG: hypothetical protein CMQ46_05115 [Gammaproteobacteria bacterium]|nr:hypothetical protein [Gammaproteobacteria bacterium]MBJ54628.1 hypothetical protein [Gammaproteobacteria bacterium]HBN14950.1 hypothetical protein [Pseudohongiella sp.]|tara:strand:+ start:702 stop:2105 length:1404 start_codon:yes stop_codon:yes gene_type:complete